MERFFFLLTIYFIVISMSSVIACIYDKYKARKGGWRVSEATLLWLSVLGGAAAMLVTMKTVRHKTRHNKFMIGLPIIIIFHIIIALFLVFKLDNGVI